jgi:capsid protein
VARPARATRPGIKASEFYEVRDALIRGKFLTQGAPNLDPQKEAQAHALEMANGTATLQDAAAEKGVDYLDLLDQLARENMERSARGLPPAGVPAALAFAAPAAPPAKDE